MSTTPNDLPDNHPLAHNAVHPLRRRESVGRICLQNQLIPGQRLPPLPNTLQIPFLHTRRHRCRCVLSVPSLPGVRSIPNWSSCSMYSALDRWPIPSKIEDVVFQVLNPTPKKLLIISCTRSSRQISISYQHGNGVICHRHLFNLLIVHLSLHVRNPTAFASAATSPYVQLHYISFLEINTQNQYTTSHFNRHCNQ